MSTSQQAGTSAAAPLVERCSFPVAGRESGFRRWIFAWLGLVPALVLLLPGCTGRPIRAEKEARQQAQAVAGDYRPHGQKPILPALTTNSVLGDFLRYAMLNQPKVESSYYDWLASIERITVARSLPDPQLTFQMDIQNIVTSIMPGLVMNFPGAGKLRAGAEAASAESQAKYFRFKTSVLESAFAVKQAYYQLYFLEEKLRVNRENLSLLTDLEQLARAQNEVGKVTLQDVLRAQIQQDRLRTDIVNLEDSRSLLLLQFKAALGLGSEAAAPPVPAKFESTPLDLNSDKLLATALAENTQLKAIEAEVRAAEAAILVAEKARVPDTSLGVMADVKMNPALYRPVATVSLPIWRDKLAAQIAEAQANKRGAQARLSAEQIALAVSFAEQSYIYRESTRKLELLHERLLPKGRQSMEVARIAYLSGQLDFFNLSDTESTLLAIELDEVEARTQRELSLAEISLVIQGMPPTNARMQSSGSATSAGGAAGVKKTGGGM